jgi:iron complex transport system ATP-binding protein
VVDGVGIEARSGSFWAIVGPNGSGKSTLLRLLGGMLKPSSGRVELGGINLRKLSAVERAGRIAFLPQQISIPFNYSARQIVALGRHPHLGMFGIETRRDWEIVDRVLADTDAKSLEHRSILQLSGGERQRVLIAAALAQSTELLLLDEPTTALDLRHQVEVYRLLKRLNRERGSTILTVTHDFNLAGQFADRIVMLSGGKVAANGQPGDVLSPETIERIYNISVHRLRHPDSDAPILAPVIDSRGAG